MLNIESLCLLDIFFTNIRVKFIRKRSKKPFFETHENESIIRYRFQFGQYETISVELSKQEINLKYLRYSNICELCTFQTNTSSSYNAVITVSSSSLLSAIY